jgi:ribosomal protein S13
MTQAAVLERTMEHQDEGHDVGVSDERPRLVTPEVAEGIVRDYQSGKKLLDIEARYGISRSTVYWVLHERGVAPSRSKPRSRMGRLTDTDVVALYQLIQAQDERILESELRLGEQDKRIKRLEAQLRKAGIEPK